MNDGLVRTLRDIRDGIRAQPARMGLSFMAIAVGITALTILLCVLGGLSERSRLIVRDLGANVFVIEQPGARHGAGRRDTLAATDVRLLRESLSDCAVAGMRSRDIELPGGVRNARLIAADADFFRVRPWRLVAGRFLDELDLRDRARVVVIGSAVARALNWKVGDAAMLRDTPFTVVGVVEVGAGALQTETSSPGLMLGEMVVFAPAGTPAYWDADRASMERIDAIFVRVPEAARLAAAVAQSATLLAQPPRRLDGLSWITPESLLRGVRRLQRTIQMTVGSIAALCLVLGGTTLVSLMLANIRDRVTEIGLRRALGATTADIVLLFSCEACLVTGAAALLSTMVTHAVLFWSRDALPVPVKLSWTTLLVPVAIALALGTLFSYWPARAAARIDPSEALRNE